MKKVLSFLSGVTVLAVLVSGTAAFAQLEGDGYIGCSTSDDCVPFALADCGIVGLESLLPLSLELVHKGRTTLLDLLAGLTCRPAGILGLPAGRLEKAAAADLVLFDLERPGRIVPETFRSKSKNSPFDDHPIQGRVLRTVVDGRTIFDADA